jgi:hypothetical protein
MFLNGVQTGSDYTPDTNSYDENGSSAGPSIGSTYAGGAQNVNIDEVRLSIGTDRGWINGFSPPTSAYGPDYPAYVQGAAASAGTGASPVTITLSEPVLQGSTLVCAFRVTTSAMAGISLSDSVNGAWTYTKQDDGGAGNSLIVGYFQNSAAGTPTLTLSWTGGGTSQRYGMMAEYTNVAAASVDVFTTNASSNVNIGIFPSPVAAIAQPVEKLIAFSALNAGAGQSVNRYNSSPNNWLLRMATSSALLNMYDATVTTLGNYQVVWGDTFDTYTSAIISLKGSYAGDKTVPYQRQNNTLDSTGPSTSLAFSNAVLAGSTLVLGAKIGDTASGITVSDSVNGSWTVHSQAEAGGPFNLVVATLQNSAAGTPNVTMNWTGTGGTITRMIVMEYINVAPVSVDQFSSKDDTPSGTISNPDTGSVTTTQASEILISFLAADTGDNDITNNYNGDATYPASNPTTWVRRADVYSSGAIKLSVDDAVVSSTGTYSQTWTSSSADNFAAAILTLRTNIAQMVLRGRNASISMLN